MPEAATTLNDRVRVSPSSRAPVRDLSAHWQAAGVPPGQSVDPTVRTDSGRDGLLTEFGRVTLRDRYLLPGESFQDMFARVATAYADDSDHARRLYDYMSLLWFMPATPILSNGGAERGLPISCFLNGVPDSLEGIVDTWNQNVWLASSGGGIGTYWGEVRSIGEKVGNNGQTSGIIPFIRVMDSLTLAISQGSLRRGSAACYIDVYHPEIEEFLHIRKPSGDFNRRSLNLHHGINITDEFMNAVAADAGFDLKSPRGGEVIRRVSARALWEKILDMRIQTGEPFLLFTDAANRAMAMHQKQLGLKVRQSNLCSEIMLHTGVDHRGKQRTAVCCLSSVNAQTFDQWHKHPMFLADVMRFLDNVLSDFIRRAPPSMKDAVYSARRERSVGLGVMGFHSFLQSRSIPFESALARAWNIKIFKTLRRGVDAASVLLAKERGSCPDAEEAGMNARFSHKIAVAPTASISIICGGVSAGIEPVPANIYTHKTLSGSFTVKNRHLEKVLRDRGHDTGQVWRSILEHEGSVAHLDCLDSDERRVFRTAFEIDQRWVIDLAVDRTPFICQSQSLNLFLPASIDKWQLHMLHWRAWAKGLKSLYYCRSKSVQRASFAGQLDTGRVRDEPPSHPAVGDDECLACQ